MPSDLEVFADILCPFTHASLSRVVAALPASASVRVHPWPLEWVNDAPLDPQHVGTEIRAMRDEVAPDLFGGFDASTFPSTSVPALAGAERAYRAGTANGLTVSLALRDAVFEHGRDVGDAEVVAAILRAHDLDGPTEADRDAVTAGYEAGKARDVTGSPHFFTGSGSWFCPGLDISKVDGEFEIHRRFGPLEEMLAAVGAETT